MVWMRSFVIVNSSRTIAGRALLIEKFIGLARAKDLGIEDETHELIKEYERGNLDHFGETKLVYRLQDKNRYSNPYYQRILEDLKRAREN